MPVVNPLARELVFKVVYYGPGLGGKTTSLQHIHATTRAEHRGKMVSLATPVDRTLYFDFLPIRVPTSRDMSVRLQLFTVPGQVYYNATRKLVLTGADGVVFVVDSQRARADANIESLRNLEENLIEHGHALEEIPHVFSYNKRDLPGIIPIDDLERLFNPRGAPSFATVATAGEGVYETLEAITRAVLEDFEHRMPEHRGMGPSALMLPEGGLAEALRSAEGPSEHISELPIVQRKVIAQELSVPDLGLSFPPADDVGERAARAFTETGLRGVAEGAEADSPIELLRAKRTSPKPGYDAMVSPMVSVGGGDSADDVIASPLLAMSHVVAKLAASTHKAEPEDGHFGNASRAESRFDTRTMISDTAPVGPVAAVPDRPLQAQRGPAPLAVVDNPPGFSLASFWTDDEQATVARIEEAIVGGEHRDAILLVAVLVDRCIEALTAELGQSPIEPTGLMQFLGMHGHDILAFYRSRERSRGTTYRPGEEESKLALLFATNLRLAVRRLHR